VFGTEFSDEDYDTVGGLVVSQFRHLPKRGESIQIGELEFLVLRADSRRIQHYKYNVFITPRPLPNANHA